MDIDHPLAAHGRGTVWHITNHFMNDIGSSEEMYFPQEPDLNEFDIALSARLINAFLAMHEKEQSFSPENVPGEGVWEMCKHEFHGELYTLLFNRDVEGFARYMSVAFRKNICWGLGGGEAGFKAISSQTGSNLHNVLIIKDRLISLAEAVGALPYENPEQGLYGHHVSLPTRDIVDRIHNKLRYEIFRPEVMGLFGLRYGDYLIDFKAPEDAYSVFRLKCLCEEFGANHVAEIGGGFGSAAFQSRRAGITSHTIFDLPIICTVQGYFLCKIYGGDAVSLYNEGDDDRPLKTLPYWEFFNAGRKFDLVYNRDSLPEIPKAHVQRYLDEIERRRVPLLSINQEAKAEAGQINLHQISVSEMMNMKMYRSQRHPYWIRKGYVEELYTLRSR